MEGWMYILQCSDGSYYVGSTNNIELRIEQHNNGEGANHTKKRLPVTLVYLEEFERIDEAFYREKQVQGWNRKKKEALINNQHYELPNLSLAYRDIVPSMPSRTSGTEDTAITNRPVVEALETTARNTEDFEQRKPLPEALEGKSTVEDNG